MYEREFRARKVRASCAKSKESMRARRHVTVAPSLFTNNIELFSTPLSNNVLIYNELLI